MFNNLFIGVSIGIVQSSGMSSIPMNQLDLSNLNLSSSDIDARLNYLYSINTTEQLISIYGNDPRTSASDEAYIGLTTPPLNNAIEE